MSDKSLTRSFAGGELSEQLFGRLDLGKYQTGLARCLNFIVTPQGPIVNRPGLEFVRAVKDSTRLTRLIPFTYSRDQTLVIELGVGYFRFHTLGATVLSAGVPYEVVNTFTESELFDVHYVQSGDVLTLTHPSHAPAELRRLAATNWTLTNISFVPAIATPAAPVAQNFGPGGGTPLDHYYVTTALNSALEESLPSPADIANNDLTVAGNYNNIGPAAVTGAVRHNVYKRYGGLYGYIGQAEVGGFTLDDYNITPDMSKTPPMVNTPFSGAGTYPGAVGYFEQRRAFAGSTNSPQTTWATRSGTESNLSYSIPAQADDSITVRAASRKADTIRHLVPFNDLIALTSGSVWKIAAPDGGALALDNISIKPTSYVGANNVQPVTTSRSILYAQARGGRVRELAYAWQQQSYDAVDVSILAPHLFDYKSITDMAYSETPHQILWAVRSDGVLLGMTYAPEHEVKAWHQHTTDGLFESVASVAEGEEDAVYVVVARTIGGVTARYVERMHSRNFAALEDCFFVDAGSTYDGAAATVISGLTHLAGKTVAILADGGVEPQQVVTAGGTITLETAASKVHVGLPYNSDAQGMPLTMEGVQGLGQGQLKNINKAHLKVYQSSSLQAGPTFEKLRTYPQRTPAVDYGSPPPLVTGTATVNLSAMWGQEGQWCLRQSDPLPVTLQAITLEFAAGG
ncbi:MAG TPA: hypothetical protein VLJ58_21420 [Ramlibacter sp.]|nr:hypothetical protein [Ramlibacter sp.]